MHQILGLKGQGYAEVKYAPKCAFGFVVVTYKQRHNSPRNRNHHLILQLHQILTKLQRCHRCILQ